MTDIFISYARSTADQARRIAEALRGLGYGVWRDDELPAHRAYAEVIEERLSAARAVVVIWSAEAAKSQWVRSEADRARGDRKLVQLTVDGSALPMPFDQIQCADLNGWTGDLNAPGWRKVAGSLGELFGQPRIPPLAGAPAPQTPRRGTAKADPMLAVLPFDNLSTDAEMQFFSDGVSEEIIQRLARGTQLKVIGRTSSFQFRGERKSEAAETLGCSHVLDGSIRRAAGRIRVAAHLVEAASKTTLWSDRFDRGLEDIFAVQDEIAEQIADALNVTFTRLSQGPIDPEAYDLYLRGNTQSDSPDQFMRSIRLLEAAAARAPHFASAWASLALMRAAAMYWEPYVDRPRLAEATRPDVERALSLEPDNPIAVSALWFLLPPFGDFIEAEALAERRSRSGAVPGILASLGGNVSCYNMLSTGRIRQANELAAREFEIDALSPFNANTRGFMLYAAGCYAEAADVLEQLVAKNYDISAYTFNLLLARIFMKDWEAVDRMLDPDWLADHPLRVFEPFLRMLKVWRDPSPENLGWLRRRIRTRVETTGHIDVTALVFASYVGLIDEVYDLAEIARFGPAGTRHDVIGLNAYRTEQMFQAPFAALRADPRFVRLCARLGLVEFWIETGKWPDCVDEVPYDFKAECARPDLPPKQAFFDPHGIATASA